MKRRTAIAAAVAGMALRAESAKLEAVVLRNSAGVSESISLAGRPALILFISTVCPISNDYNDRMITLYGEFKNRVNMLFVNANSNESMADVIAHTKAAQYPFAVYKDSKNVLADKVGAVVTPEAFLYDSAGILQYRGHIDDSRNPARVQVSGLRNAIEEVLVNKPITRHETKSFGCTIKRERKSSL